MNADVRQRIRDAAQTAWDHVWDTAPMPDGHSGALYAAIEGAEDHAAEQYRQTVRGTCAEVGVDERDYWLADPEEASVFQPECLADHLAQIEADLDAVRRHQFVLTDPTVLTEAPGNTRLGPPRRHDYPHQHTTPEGSPRDAALPHARRV